MVDKPMRNRLERHSGTNSLLGRRAFLALSAAFCATPSFGASLQGSDLKALSRINDYLNNLTTMQGAFTQIAEDGQMAEGIFFLLRPGRLRFEYVTPPELPTLVADGKWVTLENTQMRTVNRYPLSATPLKIILKEDVDLAEDTDIVAIDRKPGILSVTAKESGGLAQGELTLVFSDPALELRNWIIKDANGYVITISLRNVRRDIELEPELFIPADKP
jgi:outer membrane lipoprotein-sorting protein